MKLKPYVLDTSAILTFFKEEPGIDILDKLFSDPDNRFIISFLTLYEIYYTTLRTHTRSAADRLLRATLQLGFEVDYGNNLHELISAGMFKGTFAISAVDAWIAALALRERATLVHKDPEFEALKDHIDQITLQYK